MLNTDKHCALTFELTDAERPKAIILLGRASVVMMWNCFVSLPMAILMKLLVCKSVLFIC